jgi:hypothetical protein
MKKSIQYMSNVLERINRIRYDQYVTHGSLMNFEGYVSAGVALEQITYTEYSVLFNIAKNAYENNPSKLS